MVRLRLAAAAAFLIFLLLADLLFWVGIDGPPVDIVLQTLEECLFLRFRAIQ
jgi:hypothetical protein